MILLAVLKQNTFPKYSSPVHSKFQIYHQGQRPQEVRPISKYSVNALQLDEQLSQTPISLLVIMPQSLSTSWCTITNEQLRGTSGRAVMRK